MFAFGTFFVVWLAWPLTSVYAFIPWTLALTELVVRRPGPLTGGRAGRGDRAAVPGRPPGVELPPRCSSTVVFFVFRALLVAARRRGLELRALVRRRARVRARRCRGRRPRRARARRRSSSSCCTRGTSPARQHARRLLAAQVPRRPVPARLLGTADAGRPRGVHAGPRLVRGSGDADARARRRCSLRRSAERIAVVVFALFCVCMVVGMPPVFGLVSALPGFSAAHNERLLIYVLLSLALLAGWGLDDLSAASSPAAARRPRRCSSRAAAIFCVPIAWLVLAGTLEPQPARLGLESRVGLRAPAGAAARGRRAGNASPRRSSATARC